MQILYNIVCIYKNIRTFADMDKAITIALSIQALHASLQPGMLLGGLRTGTGKLIRWALGYIFKSKPEETAERAACWIEKPLYECTTCMGGLWTVVFYALFYGLDIGIFITVLEVIGINALIANIIQHDN